ncbi:MAG: hypothetical protein B7Z55_00355 [Planctomycetales bacterium 12-60-4]|nr:MAG: hypothetical protein B7Z55_00355 [Planctomycetales bacterium 12-60-4]
MKTLLLFIITAIAELVGCYLPYLWLRKDGSLWLLIPAVISLSAFAWLLTLHPAASGRVYAAYGGVYVATAVIWLWLIDGVQPSCWDLLGAAVTMFGMAIIMFAPRPADEFQLPHRTPHLNGAASVISGVQAPADSDRK